LVEEKVDEKVDEKVVKMAGYSDYNNKLLHLDLKNVEWDKENMKTFLPHFRSSWLDMDHKKPGCQLNSFPLNMQ
jgi:hypothetical protein